MTANKSTTDIRIERDREVLYYMAELLDNASYFMIVTDPNTHRITKVSKTGAERMGYRPEELIGKHVQYLIPQSLNVTLTDKARKGEMWESESRVVRKDGTSFPIWIAVSYIHDQEGKLKKSVVIARDIQREKAVEEHLRYLASLVEGAAYSIISTDHNNIIQSINQATEKLYGYTSEEMIGKPVKIFYSERNSPEIFDRIEEKLQAGESWGAEIWRKKKNGEEILSAIRMSYIFDEEGRIKTKISIERDITRIKEMADELARSNQLAGLGEMAAGIAHEIKNPLTGISLGLEKLERVIPSGLGEEIVLEKITCDIDRISDIVSRLLDLARKDKPEMEPVNLNEILSDVILNISSPAKQAEVELKTSFSEKLPSVNADENQIYQVFLNLALNAIQAMPEGGTLSISSTPVDSEKNPGVMISFQDTGKGIREEDLEKIFEPFYSTRKGGTGLGLAISHNIIKDHGGKIEVESTVGKGTTVNIIFEEKII